MLVEVWHSGGAEHRMHVYVPADPANYPEYCFDIAAADWRYLRRFRIGRWRRPAGTDAEGTQFAQTAYAVPTEAAQAVLAAAEPYVKDKSGAG